MLLVVSLFSVYEKKCIAYDATLGGYTFGCNSNNMTMHIYYTQRAVVSCFKILPLEVKQIWGKEMLFTPEYERTPLCNNVRFSFMFAHSSQTCSQVCYCMHLGGIHQVKLMILDNQFRVYAVFDMVMQQILNKLGSMTPELYLAFKLWPPTPTPKNNNNARHLHQPQ